MFWDSENTPFVLSFSFHLADIHIGVASARQKMTVP
jgi:hypothetical protein